MMNEEYNKDLQEHLKQKKMTKREEYLSKLNKDHLRNQKR